MGAKEYLGQAKLISEKIQNISDEIAILQAKLEGGSISFESDGTMSGYTDIYRDEKMKNKLIQLKDDYVQFNNELLDVKKEIVNTINSLSNPNHVRVLYMRDIGFNSYYAISKAMNYSEDYVKKLHRDGVEEVEKILGSRENE